MLIPLIHSALLRELAAVRRTISAYPTDADLWLQPLGIPNSGGTLVLHLAGNIQYNHGAVLGHTGYKRDRDAEFSRRNVPRAELLAEIDAAIKAVDHTMPTLTEADLEKPFPEPLAGQTFTIETRLIQMITHLAYHLGQLDYHRRMVTGDSRGIGAIAPAELLTSRNT